MNQKAEQAKEMLVPETEELSDKARKMMGIIPSDKQKKKRKSKFRSVRKIRNANGFNITIWGDPKVGKTHFSISAGLFEGLKEDDLGRQSIPAGYPVFLIDCHYGAAPVTMNPIFYKLVDAEDPSGMVLEIDEENGEEYKLMKVNIAQPDVSETNFEENPMELVEFVEDQVAEAAKVLNTLGRGTIVLDSWTNIQKAWNSIIAIALGKGAIRNPDLKDAEGRIPQHWWTVRNERMEGLVKSILSAKGSSIFIVNEGAPFLITTEQKDAYVPNDPDTPSREPKCFDDLKYLTDLVVHARVDPVNSQRFMKVTHSRYNINAIKTDTIYDADFTTAIQTWYFDIQRGRIIEEKIGSENVDQMLKAKQQQEKKEAKRKAKKNREEQGDEKENFDQEAFSI
jgi:hypothetical protein